MRSSNVTRNLAQIRPMPSRPLLLINKDRKIGWGVTSSGESMQGRYCWDVLSCSARANHQCNAVKCEKSGPYLTKSANISPYPSNVCLISSIQLPLSWQLLWGPQKKNSAHTSIDLNVIASLAGSILAKDVVNGGEAALDLIRIAMEADSGKLFLSDPQGKRLLLAACVGYYQSTHSQRQRFESMREFSNLAFAQGHPVTSLAPSARFLREEMTDMGVRSIVSVPIKAPDDRVLGCLELAWHDNETDVELVAEALWSAVSPLGNAICAAYWTLSQQIARTSSDRSAPPFADLLHLLRDSVGASAGSIIMWDERSRKLQSLDTFGVSPPVCQWMASPEAAPCSSRENNSYFRLVTLTKHDDQWPDACRQMRFDGASVSCIPVMGRATRIGRAIVSFKRNSPMCPERLLVPLQIMSEQISLHRQEPNAPKIDVTHAPAIPQLHIRCFGNFEIEIDGKNLPPSTFYRRDALTLLKILVLRAGKKVHREKIIAWLWPEVDERAGINRLYGVVHALRVVIEPHAADRRWKYVLNEGSTYSFSTDNTTLVDLIEFQKCLALAQNGLRGGYFTPNVTHYLEQAVELYRGELYEDDQCCDWCDIERTVMHREFIDALASLARSYLTLGDAKKAINSLRRALVFDSSREDLHQELIRCLVRVKRYREAKEQVRDCVRHLREDLGVEPSAETETLYHSLVNMKSGGETLKTRPR